MEVGQSELDIVLKAAGELVRQDRLKDALTTLVSLDSLYPGNLEVCALLGLVLFRQGHYREALPRYEQLVRNNLTDGISRLNLGIVLLKLDRAEDAISHLEAARTLDPGQPKTVSYLGLAYASAGRLAEAYRAFCHAGQADLAREVAESVDPSEIAAIDRELAISPHRLNARPVSNPPVFKATMSQTFAVQPPATPQPTQPAAPAVQPTSQPATSPRQPAILQAMQANSHVARQQRNQPALTAPLPVSPPPMEMAGMALTQPPPLAPPPTPEQAYAEAHPRARRESHVERMVREIAPAKSTAAADPSEAMLLSRFAASRLEAPPSKGFTSTATGVISAAVNGAVCARLKDVVAYSGDLSSSVLMRRSRGQEIGEPFATSGDNPIYRITGTGGITWQRADAKLLELDEDILYLPEELVLAFSEELRWENGYVPGTKRARSFVQFRGTGTVAVTWPTLPRGLKVGQRHPQYVAGDVLLGWVGRIVPRATPAPGFLADASAGPMSWLECSGEGVVFVEQQAS